MKQKIKRYIVLLCMCLSVIAFTGCGDTKEYQDETKIKYSKAEENQPVHAVLIVQSVETVPVVNIEAAEALLKDVCSISGSTVSIIVADGVPWTYAVIAPEEIDSSFDSVMKEQILKQRIQELVQIVKSATAVNSESDLRGAIEMGARELHSYSNGRKEMLIFGSCINTVSPIPMQEMILANIDVNATIQKLEEEAYIANLQEIDITVFNLGDTAGEQMKISNKDKEKLENLWNAYFELGNAKSICFKKDLPSSLTYEGVPEMSLVPVIENGSALTAEQMEEIEAVVLDETAIAFEKGTAVLVNPDEAVKAVSVIAEYMIQNDTQALLVGGTARWGNLLDSITLSYERGKVIKDLFISSGVKEENLIIIGTGWLSCFYQEDSNPDGSLNEEIAPSNRACTWVKASSELAENVWDDEDFNNFLVES